MNIWVYFPTFVFLHLLHTFCSWCNRPRNAPGHRWKGLDNRWLTIPGLFISLNQLKKAGDNDSVNTHFTEAGNQVPWQLSLTSQGFCSPILLLLCPIFINSLAIFSKSWNRATSIVVLESHPTWQGLFVTWGRKNEKGSGWYRPQGRGHGRHGKVKLHSPQPLVDWIPKFGI